MITTGLVDTFTTPRLLQLIEGGRLDPTPFATHRFQLEETMEAYDVFADAARTQALKVVLSGLPVEPCSRRRRRPRSRTPSTPAWGRAGQAGPSSFYGLISAASRVAFSCVPAPWRRNVTWSSCQSSAPSATVEELVVDGSVGSDEGDRSARGARDPERAESTDRDVLGGRTVRDDREARVHVGRRPLRQQHAARRRP